MTTAAPPPTAASPAPYAAAPPPRRSGVAPGVIAGLVIVALFLVVGGLAMALTLGGRTSRHVQQTYTGVRSLDVQVSAEAVELTASADDVTRLDRTMSWSLRAPRLTQRLDGDVLVVRSSCPFGFGIGCSGRTRIEVPASVDVRVHSSAGSVRVEGLSGTLDLSTSAGSVRATGLASSEVRASSSAGSVTVELASEPTRVTASSSAGSVTVLLPPGDATYRVSAKTSAGSEDVDVRTDPASDRVIDVHSSAGSVRVGYLP